ncbi:MAG: hypothetical protein WC374_11905 [Phycisphaerae bacterium]|jgi:hypothetical protein
MRLTENEILTKLNGLYREAEPFSINLRRGGKARQVRFDALGTLQVANKKIKVALEIVSTANPKNLRFKIDTLRRALNWSKSNKLTPLMAAPYIGSKQARMLRDENISWIDLCGNFRIAVPPSVYLERTGNPNKYPDTAPIKKIFQGASGLVSRALLLKPQGFESQSELVNFINGKESNITVSTVSRVLKSLEDELLISRDKSNITVRDAEKILDELLLGYKLSKIPKNMNSFRFACEGFDEEILSIFNFAIDCAARGFYAAKLRGLAASDEIEICVKSIEDFRKQCSKTLVPLKPDVEYGNIKVIETNDPGVWFNIFAAPVQQVDDIELYLEMMNDKPRGPKIAEILKERILAGFRK